MTLGELQDLADKIRRETGANRVSVVIGEGNTAYSIISTARSVLPIQDLPMPEYKYQDEPVDRLGVTTSCER